MSAPQPTAVRVRMYQVGFGDAFLFTFTYAAPLDDGRSERHLLLDFGSTSSPKHGNTLNHVADDIESTCGGKLDVIVVTHRHKDHLSGFGARARIAQIAALQPSLIVQPWTEHPDAPSDATSLSGLDGQSARFAKALDDGQTFMEQLAGALDEIRSNRTRRALGGHRGDLLRAADDEVKNKVAVDTLAEWGDAADKEFLRFGASSKIEDVIPGSKITVLGPPTIEQDAGVRRARSEDPEYWMLHQRQLRAALKATGLDTSAAAGIDLHADVEPGRVRWLVERMRDQHIAHLLRIVRELDDALNNTSLILLLEACGKKMLLPGDAQIENWSYGLKTSTESGGLDFESVQSMVKEVDLYKVSHHGSRNGTPRTLFNLWTDHDKPMVSMMCTESGVHGHHENTAVPRATLRDALAERTALYTTDGLHKDQLFIDVEATPASDGFSYAGPADPTVGLFVAGSADPH